MGCLLSKNHEFISANEMVVNLKTIPLRRIPKMLHFKSIIPIELNFEVLLTSDGQYFLSQTNKEIKYNYIPNKKRWSVDQLQSMNYPVINDDCRVTISIKEYDSICNYEHLLAPINSMSDIDIESTETDRFKKY